MDSSLKVQKVDFIGHSDFVSSGSNYLEIRDDVPDEVLASIARKLKAVDGALNWYVGDFALAVGRVRGSDRMNAFLSEWGVSERTAQNAALICETFPPSDRLDGLYFSHFRVAEEECIEKEEMMLWLHKAMREGLSTSELRQTIRRSRQEERDQPNSQRTIDYHSIQGSIKFAAVHLPTDLPPEDREILKESAPRMVEWWKQLAEL